MNILNAYKKLQSATKAEIKKHNGREEAFLCNIAENLYVDDFISKEEYNKIIEDIQIHLKSVNGGGGSTMYTCVYKMGKLNYTDVVGHANKYRLQWLKLQLIKYSLLS